MNILATVSRHDNSQQQQQQMLQPAAAAAAATATMAAHMASPWNDLATILEPSAGLSRRSSWWNSNSCFPFHNHKVLGTVFPPAEGVERCCRTHTQWSDCTRSTCLTAALTAAGGGRTEPPEPTDAAPPFPANSLSLSAVWKLSFCLAANNSCKVEKPNNK